MRARETDLLFGFAQRSLHGTLVLRLDSAARKTDLSGVGFEVRSPLRKQNGRALATLDERHQYCGRDRFVREKPPQARTTLGCDLAVPPIIDRGVAGLAQQTSTQRIPQIGRVAEHEGSIGHGV